MGATSLEEGVLWKEQVLDAIEPRNKMLIKQGLNPITTTYKKTFNKQFIKIVKKLYLNEETKATRDLTQLKTLIDAEFKTSLHDDLYKRLTAFHKGIVADIDISINLGKLYRSGNTRRYLQTSSSSLSEASTRHMYIL